MKKAISTYFYNEILPEKNEKLLEVSVDGASLHGSVLKQGTVYCTLYRSRIHERTMSLRFLDIILIILRVLRT